jgi:hypothetical protein
VSINGLGLNIAALLTRASTLAEPLLRFRHHLSPCRAVGDIVPEEEGGVDKAMRQMPILLGQVGLALRRRVGVSRRLSLLKPFFLQLFFYVLCKLKRARLEKMIARIVSSNKANMSARTKGRAPHEAQDSGVTSRPRVKHTRT